jgi:hypothetical protein
LSGGLQRGIDRRPNRPEVLTLTAVTGTSPPESQIADILLVPQGSRLIADYDDQAGFGQRRGGSLPIRILK